MKVFFLAGILFIFSESIMSSQVNLSNIELIYNSLISSNVNLIRSLMKYEEFTEKIWIENEAVNDQTIKLKCLFEKTDENYCISGYYPNGKNIYLKSKVELEIIQNANLYENYKIKFQFYYTGINGLSLKSIAKKICSKYISKALINEENNILRYKNEKLEKYYDFNLWKFFCYELPETNHLNCAVDFFCEFELVKLLHYRNNSELIIPYYTDNSQLKFLDIKVGNISSRYIYDSGASYFTINSNIKDRLINEGILRDSDFLEFVKVKLANGEIIKYQKVILPQVIIGDYKIKNVEAIITDGELLFGQSILKKFGSYYLDINKKNISFRLMK